MSALDPVLAAIDSNLDHSLDRLFELLRIKSISTDPVFAADCREAAEWLVKDLESFGFSASARQTPGHPIVVGHHEGPSETSPHVLVYGHYDVQPVDPLNLWHTDPFEPTLATLPDERKVITGRGAADDKGQLMLIVEALRTWKSVHGSMPCRITVLLEGEEECGSPSIGPFLHANAEELKADFALVCDTSMWGADTPAISTSLRGLTADELVVHAASRDLHSGYYGGVAANPIHVLSKILGDIHDANGRVTIPNFYDGVEETPSQILASWEELAKSGADLLGDVGLAIPSGEKGRSVLELTWARPTAEINGISGGYTGDGFKTVIPAQASAKVSFRLVHRQDPLAIRDNFREFVRSRIPEDCSVEFIDHVSGAPLALSADSYLVQKAAGALADEWGKPAAMTGMGGSIPIVTDFYNTLGMESLLTGFGKDDDNIHSPNEKYDLTSFHKGQRSWARILHAISSQ